MDNNLSRNTCDRWERKFVGPIPHGVEISPSRWSRKPRVLNRRELGDVILFHGRHTKCGPVTNVPRVYDFSENDNWGYSGTGPACLAQNILFHFSGGDERFAEEKWVDFLSVLRAFPIDKSCVIHKEAILAWINQNQAMAEVIPFPSK